MPISHPIFKLTGGFLLSTIVSYQAISLANPLWGSGSSDIAHSSDKSITQEDSGNKTQSSNLSTVDSSFLSQDTHKTLAVLRTEIKEFGPADFRKRVESLLAKRDALSREIQCGVVMEEWAFRYPDEALLAMTSIDGSTDTLLHRLTPTLQASLLDGLLAAAPEKTLQWLHALPPGNEKLILIHLSVKKLGQSDPEAAFNLIEANKKGGARLDSFLYGQLLEGVLERDPAKTIEYFSRIPEEEQQQNYALHLMISHWVELDPPAALSWIENLPDPTLQANAMQVYFSAYGSLAPNAAIDSLKQVLSNTKASDKTYLLSAQLLGYLNPTDREGAFAWMKEHLSETDFNKTRDTYAQHLLQTAPEQVIEMLTKGEISSTKQNSLFDSALSLWLARDGEASLRWMRENRADLTPQLFESLKHTYNPLTPRPFLTIMEASKLLPEGALRDDLITSLASDWMKVNPAACETALKSIPEGPLRDKFHAEMLAATAKSSPESALAELQRLPDGQHKDAVGLAMVKALSATDPKQTIQLMEKLGITNSAYYKLSFRQWVNSDPMQSAKWLETLPAGKLREDTTYTLTTQLAIKSPPEAAKWAERLIDRAQREKALLSIGKQWISYDRTAGSLWVSQSTLSPKSKESLLKAN